MSNKIIQRIRIDGKNWNDIISLPCVQSLDKGDERFVKDESKRSPHFELYDSYLPEKYRLKSMPSFKENLARFDNPKSPMWQRIKAMCGSIGDELVQYDDGTWRVQKSSLNQ